MSLSLRIFFWFWLSVILVAAITFVWARGDLWSPTPLTAKQQAFVVKQQARVEQVLEKQKRRTNMLWLEKRGNQTAGNIWWLYDLNSKSYINKRVPKQLLDKSSEVLNYAEPMLFKLGPHWVIGPVVLPNHPDKTLFIGLSMVMVRNLHWEQLLRNSPILLVGVILVLAIISYLVARQIARPLESIRSTAEQIANGDFKAEVEPKLLNRKDEIGSLSRTASQMGRTIDAALEAHKRLLSDVSHELRSPLTRLSLANTLMTKRFGSQPENARIDKEVDELNGMIEQLLTLSRLQLQPAKERKPVELRSVLKRCVADAEFSFPELQIELHDETCSEPVPMAKGGDELLTRAVQNVLNNASRYCQKIIRVQLRDRGNHWLIKIEDDGIGVPESELSKLFVPFYRPEFARQRDKGGTGLGLAIVEQAIQFHGGQVKAEISDMGGLAILMVIPKQRA